MYQKSRAKATSVHGSATASRQLPHLSIGSSTSALPSESVSTVNFNSGPVVPLRSSLRSDTLSLRTPASAVPSGATQATRTFGAFLSIGAARTGGKSEPM